LKIKIPKENAQTIILDKSRDKVRREKEIKR
jgi:hypothetical protein